MDLEKTSKETSFCPYCGTDSAERGCPYCPYHDRYGKGAFIVNLETCGGGCRFQTGPNGKTCGEDCYDPKRGGPRSDHALGDEPFDTCEDHFCSELYCWRPAMPHTMTGTPLCAECGCVVDGCNNERVVGVSTDYLCVGFCSEHCLEEEDEEEDEEDEEEDE